MTEPSVCGGDAALCQITLTTCYMTVICRFASEAASMEQAAGRCGSGSTSHTASKPSTSQQQQQQATDIPEGLYDLLKGVTVAVLRDRPSDLYSFVADYFTKVRQQLPSRLPCHVAVWSKTDLKLISAVGILYFSSFTE